MTLMPVSFVNRVASAMSRVCPPPTESPMNVIDWPPYFALIAAAFGTLGAAMVALADVARVVPAEAMLRETTRARTTTDPVPKMNRRRFKCITSFLAQHPLASSIAMNRPSNLDPTTSSHRVRSIKP